MNTFSIFDVRKAHTFYPMPSSQRPVDLYNMVGFCPERIIRSAHRFAFRNLVDASDTEVQKLQKKLLHIVGEKIIRFPKRKPSGFVLHSGSEANEVALFLAHKKTKKHTIIGSNLTHHSIQNACDKLGLQFISLPVNPKNNWRVDPGALHACLKKHHPHLAALCITLGTTKLGTSEDFLYTQKVERICAQNHLWIHLDAAYGGIVLNLLRTQQNQWYQSPSVRSLTVDPHKFFGVLGCSTLLVPYSEDTKLLGPEVAYFSGTTTALGTTRSAFPTACAVRMFDEYGINGLTRLAHDCHAKAQWVATALEKNNVPLLAQVESAVVPIRLKSWNEVKRIKRELLKAELKVSPIEIIIKKKSFFGIRIVVTPKREMTWQTLKRFIQTLLKKTNSLLLAFQTKGGRKHVIKH